LEGNLDARKRISRWRSPNRAIQNGFDALFATAAELIDDLSAAFRSGRLADALARYIHPAVLIVDEVGYLTYGTDAANMLFHVVNDRHRTSGR
jgi:DNA replication protein DnaC